MLFSMKIRRECMIDQDYWKKIASKWAAESDGIEIPEVEAPPDDFGLDDEEFGSITDELDDILADIEI